MLRLKKMSQRQSIYGWLLLSPAMILLTTFAFYSMATFFSQACSVEGPGENQVSLLGQTIILIYLLTQLFGKFLQTI